MSEKQLAIRGVALNWFGRAASIFVTLFLTPFLVHNLGDERYGLWAVVMSLTSYYALADLGLRGASIKYISKYEAVKDFAATNRIVSTSLVVYSVFALLVGLAAAIASGVFPLVMSIEGESPRIVSLVVFLTGLTMAIRMVGQVFGATITALQRHDLSNVIGIISQLFRAAILVVVIRMGGGILGMAVVTVIISIVNLGAEYVVAKRLIPEVTYSWRYYDRVVLKDVLSFGGMSIIPQMARRVVEYIGSLLVGVTLGPAAATFYAIPESIANKSRSLGSGIARVIFPLVSRLDAQNRRKELVEVLVLTSRAMLAMSLCLAAVFIIQGRSIVGLWIGPDYVARSYPVLVILSLAMVARIGAQPFRQVLRGLAHLRPLATSAAIEVVVVAVIAPPLIIFFRLPGMALAILASQVIAVTLLLVVTTRLVEISISSFASQAIVRGAVAAIPALAISALLDKYLHPEQFAFLALEVAAVGLASGISIFYICLENRHRTAVLAALVPQRNTAPLKRAANSPPLKLDRN